MLGVSTRKMLDSHGKERSFVTYITCDSSPPVKRDWLLGMVCRVPEDQLLELSSIVQTMWQSTHSDLGFTGGHDDDGMAVAVKTEALQCHVLTPVVIGSGRASAKH